MTVSQRPKVTVAIPLHASVPWVDVVAANIAALDDLDAEIIVSDATCVDDAAGRLAELTRGDPRVSVVAEPRGLDWVAHHRELFAAARGEYVVILPHDDDFGPGYVADLVAALDRHPDAVVACGAVEISHPGAPDDGRRYRVPRPRGRWSALSVARLFTFEMIGYLYRGVFRTAVLRREGIGPRPGDGGRRRDDLFVFEVLLCGPPVEVDGVRCTKRVHPGATHVAWGASPRHMFRLTREALQILWMRRTRDPTAVAASVVVAIRPLRRLTLGLRARVAVRTRLRRIASSAVPRRPVNV